MSRIGPWAVLALVAIPAACEQAEPAPPAWFREVAAEAGLHFRHESGHRERFFLPEIMGGGAALLDMDDDGDLDVYLVQGGRIGAPPASQPPNRLYRNAGGGRFEDVTEGSGAEAPGYGMGCATGDYDGDGDPDLYVTNCGPNVLLRNDGAGRFTDVTEAAGVGDPGWSTAATFLDYDRDGDLDLFVVSYLYWSVESELDCYNDLTGGLDYCSPGTYKAPTPDRLYANNGDGTFTDVTTSTGLDAAFGTGLGVVVADFTADGRPDLFVANDGMPDRLWVLGADGRFTDEALIRGCAVDEDGDPKAGMGVAVADLDHDERPDVLVGNLRSETDSLHLNVGAMFVDGTAAAGLAMVSRPFTRFGLGWADFDHDGRLDLYEANGRVMRYASEHPDDPFAEPNLLFRGGADGRFVEVEPRGGTTPVLVATSRAAAFGDVDNDGDVDLLVVNRDAPAHLLLNEAAPGLGWVRFRVRDRAGADAIGAVLRFEAGTRVVTREVRTSWGYLAAHDPRVHVGLGPEAGVANVTVRWPDGRVEAFGDFDAGREHELRYGSGASGR